MLRNKLQQSIANVAKQVFPLEYVENINITHPAQSEHGDYSTNIAMILAKKVGQSPQNVAITIIERLRNDDFISELFSSINVAGPGFINFHLKDSVLFRETERYMELPTQHQDNPGSGSRIMVEYSSPNIAKPFNVGHLRSTIIGDSIARIFSYLGYEVLRDNHLGDWGTQYGKLAYAVDTWGDWSAIEKDPIKELFQLYVRFHQEEDANPELANIGREYFKKLENKDPHTLKTWERLVKLSLDDFEQIYKLLDVNFDMQLGESFYEPMLADIIEECKSSGVARESEGALLIFFDSDPQLKNTPLMIQKSNGTSTYGTRDLAGIKYRINKFNLSSLYLEMGNEQQHYMKQVIKAAEMLGWVEPGQVVHIGHGLFMLPTGKMSTRKGETVWVRELIAELEQTAKAVVSQRQEIPDNEQADIVSAIAFGALKYNDLSQNRLGNVVFDKEKSLSLEGNSAPYLQYTVARSRSVLRNSEGLINQGTKGLISAAQARKDDLMPAERNLIALISQFDETVQDAAQSLLPNTLANYLFNLSQAYNTFYQSCPILSSDPGTKEWRLSVVVMTNNVMSAGLNLLGIKTVERM